jgi:hypothetical protein
MPTPPTGTFSLQHKLPRLPVPPLEDTLKRYLRSLRALQDDAEHDKTKAAVEQFLAEEGPRIQEKLVEYAKDKDSYIEEFWYESYLAHSDPVVLRLNPFFVLEDDPTPSRGSQLPRAASLIIASLGFIHDLRTELLQPDTVRGIPLDMDQYRRLFGTARIPTPVSLSPLRLRWQKKLVRVVCRDVASSDLTKNPCYAGWLSPVLLCRNATLTCCHTDGLPDDRFPRFDSYCGH